MTTDGEDLWKKCGRYHPLGRTFTGDKRTGVDKSCEADAYKATGASAQK